MPSKQVDQEARRVTEDELAQVSAGYIIKRNLEGKDKYFVYSNAAGKVVMCVNNQDSTENVDLKKNGFVSYKKE